MVRWGPCQATAFVNLASLGARINLATFVTLLLINTKGVDNNKGMGNTDVVGEIKEVNNTKMVDKAKVRKVTIVGGVGGDHCGRLTTPW